MLPSRALNPELWSLDACQKNHKNFCYLGNKFILMYGIFICQLNSVEQLCCNCKGCFH